MRLRRVTPPDSAPRLSPSSSASPCPACIKSAESIGTPDYNAPERGAAPAAKQARAPSGQPLLRDRRTSVSSPSARRGAVPHRPGGAIEDHDARRVGLDRGHVSRTPCLRSPLGLGRLVPVPHHTTGGGAGANRSTTNREERDVSVLFGFI